MKKNKQARKPVNLGRHEANCTICAHESREDIERDFIDWVSPGRLAQNYGLSGPMTVYRHARALGLSVKRERNIRAALVKIIEKAGEVEASAQAVVAAVQAYSKINSAGDFSKPWIGPWQDCGDVLTRTVYIPSGTNFDTHLAD